ncbi:hypothetical protein, partial [Thauera sp.]|uniref:hypothetical protein n=1 Tax=Thauera sp. TaxID=1905334 RepID=UPI001B6A8E9B
SEFSRVQRNAAAYFLSCLSGSEYVMSTSVCRLNFLSCLSGSELEVKARMLLIVKEKGEGVPKAPFVAEHP